MTIKSIVSKFNNLPFFSRSISSLLVPPPIRTFTTISTNYPVTSTSSLFESINDNVVKAAGEGSNTNL